MINFVWMKFLYSIAENSLNTVLLTIYRSTAEKHAESVKFIEFKNAYDY